MVNWQYAPYILPLFIAAAISVALAHFGWQRRSVSGAVTFAWLMLAVAEWSLTYGLELASGPGPSRLFWLKAQYPSLAFVPLAWLAFTLQYTGHTRWLTRRNLALLALIPLTTLVLAWTNSAHGLIWSEMILDSSGPLPVFDMTYGSWTWVHIGYSYLLLLTGTLLIIQAYLQGESVYRQQAGILLIGALLPGLGSLLYVFGLSPVQNIDLGPFAFTLSGLLIAWSLFRFQFLDLLPVARDSVLESMADGVIIVDAQNRVVDLNPAAARIINRLPSEVIGQPAVRMFTYRFDLFERYRDAIEAREEITLGEGEARRTYDLRISPLHDQRGHFSGRLVVLRDVTTSRQAGERIAGLNRLRETLIQAGTLEEKLACITDGVVEIFGADFARIWLIKPGDLCDSGCVHASVTEGPHVCRYRDLCLHLVTSSGRYTHIDGQMHRRVPFGSYKIGRVAARDDPKFITNDAAHDPRIHDRDWATELGLVSFAGYRLLSESGEPMGVLALFGQHVISSEQDALLEGLANTTAQVIHMAEAEKALREGEARFRDLFDGMPICSWAFDQDGTILHWNQACEELYGWTAERAIGKTMYELMVDSENVAATQEKLAAVFQGQSFKGLEYQDRRADGTKRDVLVNEYPLWDASGRVVMGICAQLDITERKQAEKALRRSEGRLRAFAQALPDLAFIIDENGYHLEILTSQEHLLYVDAAQMKGRSLHQVLPADRADRILETVRRTIETGKPQVLEYDLDVFKGHVWFEGRAAPMTTVPGEPRAVVWVSRDITARKQAEEALRESEERSRALSEGAFEAIFFSEKGICTEANHMASEMFGYTYDELIGIFGTDVIAEESKEIVKEKMLSGYEKPYRAIAQRKDGTKFPAEFQGKMYSYKGRRVRVTAVRDLTEQVRAEEALREREQFLAMLNDITRAALETTNLQTMLQTLADRLGELFDADACFIRLWDEAAQMSIPGAASGEWREDYASTYFDPDEATLAKSVMRTGHSLVVDDTLDTPHISCRIAEMFSSRSVLGLPLIVDDRKLGVAIIAFNEPYHFMPEQVARGEQAAGQIALALAKALLLEEAGDRVAELEALQRTSLQLTSSLELPTVIEAIVENALTLVGATDCHIYLYDEASETFTFGSALWQDGRREAAVKAPRRDGFTATIARKGRPVVIDNVPSHPLYAAPEAQKWNLQAVAGFPLIWAGRVLGVLTIAFTEPHTFSPEELRVLGLLANQAAIAIENAQLFKAEQAQLRLAQTLQEVGALLTAQMSLEEVFERLFDLLARVVTCDSISIFVPVDENRVRLAAHRGFDDIEAVREFVANLEWQTLVERWGQKSVALISDTHEDENWFIAPGVAHIRAHVGAALVVQGRLIGELNVDSKEVGAYDAVTAETVAAFANQAAIAIENARLYQEIQTHAEDMEWRVEERTKELRLEQERSSAILRSVSDAIVMADLEMRIQYVNPAFTAMTGYTAAEAMGQHVSLVYQGSTTGHAARSIRQALAQGNTWQGEVVIQRKDGRTYDSALVITPMKDVEGNLLGYVSTNRDISQLKEMERTRRRFMSNVSHQLRTPAANMKLYAQLMQGGRRPERQEHYLQVLVEQADRLTALVLDILRMSELDSSQATMNWESLSLSSLLGDTITSYLGQAKDAGLTLIAAPLPSDLPVVKGDSVWLAQALHELVENAIIFTPSGGQVTIEAGIIEQEGQEWVTISVADSGPGISAEEQGKVFDRFFRGVLAESGHVPGTGLGLSYVQEVMNAHGGRVTLTSEVGQGSVFTLWLRSQA